MDDVKQSSDGVCYERLFQWKKRHGVRDTGQVELTADAIKRSEDSRNPENAFCWMCGVDFPITKMVVDTNPYIQFDECPRRADGYIPEEHRIRACERCHKKEESEAEGNPPLEEGGPETE